MPTDELITKVVIKYAVHMQIIRQNRDKDYVYIATGQELGKTLEEVFNSLMNPKYSDCFSEIKKDVEKEVKIY